MPPDCSLRTRYCGSSFDAATVRLTSVGKQTVDGAFETLLASERSLLSDLPDPDRTRLAELLKQLMVPLR